MSFWSTMKWYMPAQTNPPPVLCPALTPLLGEPWEFPDDNRNLNHTYSMLGLYLSGAWKPVSEPARRYWQISYCVPLPPSSLSLSYRASYFPLWINPRTLHLQLWMGPIKRFSEPYLTSAWKKSRSPPSPPLRAHLPVQPWNDTPI